MSVNAAVERAMAGEVIRTTMLIFCAFGDGDEYLALTPHDVKAGDHRWTGIGHAVKASPITRTWGTAAAKHELVLAGLTDAMSARSFRSRDLVRGRPMICYRARFDANWQLLVAPFVVFRGLMDSVTLAGSGTSRTTTLTSETRMAQARVPAHAYLSDADIRARNPGDLGGQYIAAHANRRVDGPVSF